MKSTQAKFGINLILLKLGWLACVLGGANDLALLGTIAVLGIALIHLHLVENPAAELKLLLIAGCIGLGWDSLLVSLGWISYPSGTVVSFLAPHWIVAMWVLFGTALNVSLSWLKGRLPLAAVFGGIGGPAAFYAGAKLGGVEFADPLIGLSAQAVGWAILMPVLTVLATRFDGVSQPPQTQVAQNV